MARGCSYAHAGQMTQSSQLGTTRHSSVQDRQNKETRKKSKDQSTKHSWPKSVSRLAFVKTVCQSSLPTTASSSLATQEETLRSEIRNLLWSASTAFTAQRWVVLRFPWSPVRTRTALWTSSIWWNQGRTRLRLICGGGGRTPLFGRALSFVDAAAVAG